jgi:peroxin-13
MQMHGVVVFFGRVSFLVDQNTQAFHFFITALLQVSVLGFISEL